MPSDQTKTLNKDMLCLAGRGCSEGIVSFVRTALSPAFHVTALNERPPQHEIKTKKENF